MHIMRILAVSIIACLSAAAAECIADGGFEADGGSVVSRSEYPPAKNVQYREWTANFFTQEANGILEITEARAHSGKYSFHIKGTSPKSGGQIYTKTLIPVKSGSRIAVSLFYLFESGSKANVRIMWLNGDGKETEKSEYAYISADGSGGWQAYSGDFTVPETAVSVRFYVLLWGEQSLFIDDVSLQSKGTAVDARSAQIVGTRILKDIRQTGAPIRIMPLGDSITAADPGYKGFLARMLIDGGYSFEFVGGEKSTNSVGGHVLTHEGHGGFTIGPGPSYLDKFVGEGKGNIYTNLEKYLSADPEIILLLIGVNEYFNIRGMQKVDPDVDGPRRLTALLDRIHELKPNARILVASILPVKRDANLAKPFNAEIPAIVAAREYTMFVDAHTKVGFVDGDWKADGTHPDESGNEKLAKVWFDALAPLLTSAKNTGDTASDGLRCSAEFGLYAKDETARTRSVDEIYERTLTKTVLTEEQAAARKAVIEMYRTAGIDVSLDNEENWSSKVLLAKMPKTWSTNTPQPLSGDYTQPYSVDAAWNLMIPKGHTRAALPDGYFRSVQLTSPNSIAFPGGDGIGMGISIAKPADPVRTIVKAWTKMPAQAVIEMRISETADQYASQNKGSDRHVLFIDPAEQTAVWTMKIRLPGDPLGVIPIENETYAAAGLRDGYYARALSAGIKHRLDGIGSEGVTGSTAAGFTQLGILLRTGEVIDPVKPIRHALGGPSGPLMKARVYPAVMWDSFISRCAANYGALPYGAVVQLDPDLDLAALYKDCKLSLPAFRILEAVQNYGWYMVDSSDGGSGKGVQFGIYAANPASEMADIRPPSVDSKGAAAVNKELNLFFSGDAFFGGKKPKFFVAAPLVKYE